MSKLNDDILFDVACRAWCEERRIPNMEEFLKNALMSALRAFFAELVRQEPYIIRLINSEPIEKPKE